MLNRRELLAHGIILFLFAALLVTRSGPPTIPLLFSTYPVPLHLADVLSYVVIWPIAFIAGAVSLSCLVGVFRPTSLNWMMPLLQKHETAKKWALVFYGLLFMTAFYWNFAVSWTARLADAANRGWAIWPVLFFGLAWLPAAVFALAWRKIDTPSQRVGGNKRRLVRCSSCGFLGWRTEAPDGSWSSDLSECQPHARQAFESREFDGETTDPETNATSKLHCLTEVLQ